MRFCAFVIAAMIGFAAQDTAVQATAAASGQRALADTIVVASTNITPEAEHFVEIDNCTMTTWVYKPKEGHGMQLWSSFVFDMRMTRWNAGARDKFFSLGRTGDTQEPGYAMIRFKMRGQAVAIHEVPQFRVASQSGGRASRPSPRQGVEPCYFIDSTSFFIGHRGVGVHDKAVTFTELYDQYVAEYRRVIG